MRVLLLRRQTFGGIATITNNLVPALAGFGVEARVEEATTWIPNQTDDSSSRPATKRLKEVGSDYDLVHAFGYRAAWACSDAFGAIEGWLYTAYDFPKTTHLTLVDKLNQAQLGLCSSYAVRDALSAAGVMELLVRYPGLPPDLEPTMSKAEARSQFGLPDQGPLVAGLGRFVPERAFGSLIDAMETVWQSMPDVHLVLAGQGPEEDALKQMAEASERRSQISFLRVLRNPADLIACADLVVVPSPKAGFSMVAAESMLLGTPVLLKGAGGFGEIAEPEHTAFFLDQESQIGERIVEALQMPITLQSISHAAKIKAESFFSIRAYAEAISKAYRSVLE